ncbi:hypothetical protein FOQG_19274 [Fusarium oxysporum f. sp. raphani 54005]|uniref:Uncharacterized protein n=1 Tax=Fusarium oxysporum f. sp. raphani 54005 TaxID=1089458 RepID=X0B1H0_FUSOX|nr:hypothetical protein FOQG_19274 [Fusarium oxysporum f. sp. raphani 54005]
MLGGRPEPSNVPCSPQLGIYFPTTPTPSNPQ